MSKLDGTAGQFFSVIADAINLRGTARSGKGSRAQANGSAGFRDLLHKVSNPAPHGQGDQDHDGSIEPGMLRARGALRAELDKLGDETARKLPETAEEPDASGKSAMSDHAATADASDQSLLPSSMGQSIAAIPALKPQARAAGDDEESSPARKDRSSSTLILKVDGGGGAALGIIMGVLAGLVVGIVNGVVSTYLRINPLIATLAMSFIILGATKLVSQFGKTGVGQIRVDFPEFRWLATTKPLGVSLPTWIAFVIIVILAIVLWRTTFGRYIYAAGGNAEAARLAGIRVNLVRISTFALTGLAAGAAGVIDLARTPSVPENDAIATTLTFTVLAGIAILAGAVSATNANSCFQQISFNITSY